VTAPPAGTAKGPHPGPVIREERTGDAPAIHAIQAAAFAQEDEARLVDALRGSGCTVLSLLALVHGAIVGHILFSTMRILPDGPGARPVGAIALAPIAVGPGFKGRGIGAGLSRRGLDLLRQRGLTIVLVLGEPVYYRRFGFRADLAAGLRTPFPAECFMALELEPGAVRGVTDSVEYPPAFGVPTVPQ